MSIFKELRERKGWSKYQAALEMKIPQNVYQRLEEGTTGERYLKMLLKMLKITGTNLSEIKKILAKKPDTE